MKVANQGRKLKVGSLAKAESQAKIESLEKVDNQLILKMGRLPKGARYLKNNTVCTVKVNKY